MPQNPKKKKANTGEAVGTSRQAQERMEKFVLAYHADPNAQKAAIKAGYSEKTAGSAGSRLLKNGKVISRLAELALLHRQKSIATAEERQQLLTQVLRDEVQDVATGGKELEWIHTPVPVAERIRAADMLAKMNGEYTLNINLKVTEYAKNWLEDLFTILDDYLPAEKVDEIAGRLRRFNP